MKTLLLAMLVLLGQARSSRAITIILDFQGGNPPTNSIGGGNLTNIVTAAAAYLTNIFRDPGTVTIHYYWSPSGTQHFIQGFSGTPARETEGTITFQANGGPGTFVYYLDPNPWENEEYTNYYTAGADLGGGNMTCLRYFTGGPGGSQYMDLKTTAIYELGHALGLCQSNPNFISSVVQTNGGYYIPIGASLPYAGSLIPLRKNNRGVIADLGYVNGYNVLLGGSWAPGTRTLMSPYDAVALAQISKYTNVNWSALGDGCIQPSINIDTEQATVNGSTRQSGGTQIPGTLSLSWGQPLFGTYQVERCSSLSLRDWAPVAATVTFTNGVYSASVQATGPVGFFRLKQQLQ